MKGLEQKDLTRIEAVLGFMAADNGEAFVLVADTSRGPMNLEFTDSAAQGLLRGLLQASVACAVRRPAMPAMADTDPAGTVYLPTDDIQVLPVRGAYKRLVVRAGVIDFSIIVPDAKTAQGLAQALLD